MTSKLPATTEEPTANQQQNFKQLWQIADIGNWDT